MTARQRWRCRTWGGSWGDTGRKWGQVALLLISSIEMSRPRKWGRTLVREPNSETKELPFAGDYVVESPIIAVLTRFGLRRPWHLLQTYLAYRWLIRRVRRTAPGGLLKAVFLVENSRTCWSLSLWADESAIPHFGTSVTDHVSAARDVFRRVRFNGDLPEIWSTKWRLSRVSNNLNWEGWDLGHVTVRQEQMQR